MDKKAGKEIKDQFITVFICFLKSGLRFNREDTNAVGQTLSQELRKQNPEFKPVKVQQREKKAVFTVNGYPRAFEPLIMACIQEYQKEKNLPKRLAKPGFRSGPNSRVRREGYVPRRPGTGGSIQGNGYGERRPTRPDGMQGNNYSPRPYSSNPRPYGQTPPQDGYRRSFQGPQRDHPGGRLTNPPQDSTDQGNSRYPQRQPPFSGSQDPQGAQFTPPFSENPLRQEKPQSENPFRFIRKKPDNLENKGSED